MLRAVYFHPFSSRVAASVVGIDNDRESQWSGYQLPPVAGQNSYCNAYKGGICSGCDSWKTRNLMSRYLIQFKAQAKKCECHQIIKI
jgi:hypothetical protein